MTPVQVWHFFDHFQQEIMLQPNVSGDARDMFMKEANLDLVQFQIMCHFFNDMEKSYAAEIILT